MSCLSIQLLDNNLIPHHYAHVRPFSNGVSIIVLFKHFYYI